MNTTDEAPPRGGDMQRLVQGIRHDVMAEVSARPRPRHQRRIRMLVASLVGITACGGAVTAATATGLIGDDSSDSGGLHSEVVSTVEGTFDGVGDMHLGRAPGRVSHANVVVTGRCAPNTQFMFALDGGAAVIQTCPGIGAEKSFRFSHDFPIAGPAREHDVTVKTTSTERYVVQVQYRSGPIGAPADMRIGPEGQAHRLPDMLSEPLTESWPKNEYGLTVGIFNRSDALAMNLPDLAPMSATVGKDGFAKPTDFVFPSALTTEEELRQQRDRYNRHGHEIVDLYAADGKTVVGQTVLATTSARGTSDKHLDPKFPLRDKHR